MQKLILLAESNLQDQELFLRMISGGDTAVEVHTVPAGKDVITYLQKCPGNELPCLVVLDEDMPLMGPADLLPLLTQDPRYANVAFAVWAEAFNEAQKNLMIEAGAKAYFIKPLTDLEVQEQAALMLEFCNVSIGSGDTALPEASV